MNDCFRSVFSLMESPTTPDSVDHPTGKLASSSRKRCRKARSGRSSSDAPWVPPSVSPPLPTSTADSTGQSMTLLGSSSTSLVIDVVCGLNRARLYVDGLRNGSKTPCVYMLTTDDTHDEGVHRLGGTWMTPNQFQHASGRGTARDWKRSIKHHGTSLKALISSHVLTVDPPSCRCAGCIGVVPVGSQTSTLSELVLDMNCVDQAPLNLSTSSAGTSPPPPLLTAATDDGGCTVDDLATSVNGDDTFAITDGCTVMDHEEVEEEEEDFEEEDMDAKMEIMTALCLQKTDQLASSISASTVASRKRQADVPFELDWAKLMHYHVNGNAKRPKTTTDSEERYVTRGHCAAGHQRVATFDLLAMASFTDAHRKLSVRRDDAEEGDGDADVESASRRAVETGNESAAAADDDEGFVERRVPTRGCSAATFSEANDGPEMKQHAVASTGMKTEQNSIGGTDIADSSTNAVYPLTASLRRAMNGEDRDATLTHIINELRDYKKRLVEQLDASRRISSHLAGDHRRRQSDHQQTDDKSDAVKEQSTAAKSTRPPKELPDLVRSAMPYAGPTPTPLTANVVATHQAPTAAVVAWKAGSPCGTPSPRRTAPSGAPLASFPVDASGAVDLSVRAWSPATAHCRRTSLSSTTNDAPEVLDLSCRTSRTPTPTVRPLSSTSATTHLSPLIAASSIALDKPEAEVYTSLHRHSHHHHEHRHSISGQRRHRKSSKSSSSSSTTSTSSGVAHGLLFDGLTDNDNPLRWSVRDVIEFVSEVPGCQVYAETFKRFGVRGASLPVLTLDHMTGILRMDPDAARSLRVAIDRMMTSYAAAVGAAAS